MLERKSSSPLGGVSVDDASDQTGSGSSHLAHHASSQASASLLIYLNHPTLSTFVMPSPLFFLGRQSRAGVSEAGSPLRGMFSASAFGA